MPRSRRDQDPDDSPGPHISDDQLGQLAADIVETGDGSVLAQLLDLVGSSEAVADALAEMADADPEFVYNLASAWEGHFHLTGRADSLDRAVAGFEQCAARIPAEHPAFPVVMTAIALALRSRIELSETRADVDRAVEVLRAAHEIPTEDDVVRADRAGNLGTALQDRYESADQADDLDQAIELHQQAVAGAPSKSRLHGNLGNSLKLRYLRTQDQADLDRAVEELKIGVGLDSGGGSPRLLNNFGLALELRFEALSAAEDQDQAVELFRAALARLPGPSLDSVIFSRNLGRALWRRYRRTANRSDLDGAAAAYAAAVEMDLVPYGRRPLGDLWAYAFILLEGLDSPRDAVRAPRAVRAFDLALAAFPADGEDHARLAAGRRSAVARLARPATGETVRLDGRSAFVLTGEHRGQTHRVVSVFAERQAILLGFDADPVTARFADTMNHIDRVYPAREGPSTWLVLRLAARDGVPTRDLVLRYHADEAVDDAWLALDALRATAEPAASHGPFTLPGGSLAALVLVGHFAGAERYVCLMGDDAENWLAAHRQDPGHANGYFFDVLGAALADGPEARVVVAHGGVVRGWFELPQEPMSPQELAEALLEQAGPGAGPGGADEPFDPAGYDQAGQDAMTWHLEGAKQLTAFDEVGDPVLLDRACVMFRHAVKAIADPHVHRPLHLRNLAVALERLFEVSGGEAALAEAVTVWKEIVRAPGADWRYGWRLGIDLRMWGELTYDLAVLAEAIAELRRAAGAVQPGTAEEASVLDSLSLALRGLVERTGDPGLAEEAVTVGRRMVALAPDHADRLGHLDHLAAALRLHAQVSGELDALDEAIELLRRAVTATDSGEPNAGTRLHNLGGALWARSALRAAPADFDEALGLLRLAVAQTPDDEPNRAHHLHSLAMALAQRFDETGDRALLEEALGFQREAVIRTPAAAAVYFERARALSAMLERRYLRSGAAAALEENVTVARRLLSQRFARHGESRDLEEAIEVLHGAAGLPAEPDGQAGVLNALALALVHRHSTAGDLAALREAVDLERRAVALTPGGSPDLAGLLSNLGNFCLVLFGRTGDQALLEEAVAVGRKALAADPAEVMDRVGCLTNLGLALKEWYLRAGDAAAGAEAVQLLRRAVELTPPDYHDRGLYLSNLQVVMSVTDADDAVLEEAIATGRRAVEVTPYGAARSLRLTNLLVDLTERHERHQDPGARTEVINIARTIAGIGTAAPLVRVRAAAAWGEGVADGGDWAVALRAFALGVDLLPMVAPRDLTRADQEYGLTGLGRLASDGAACALRAGDPERALALLEQGRGVLLAQALDDRGDLTALRQRSPDLADRFEHLRDRLGDPGTGTDTARLQLAREWNELITEIRTAPEWEDFHRPPRPSLLLPQGKPGPIAIINVSRLGSDAVILTAGGIRVVPLPDLTPGTLVARIEDFWERQRSGADISVLLGWLWDTVAGPVLEDLGLSRTPRKHERWPRIWWSAAGPLALLPLHAAGHHDERGDTCARTVLDRAISSYTPTVRALQYARGRASAARPGPKDVLVVSLPDAPGAAQLPGVRRETELLLRRFPGATVLAGPDATHDRVLQALGSHRVAHFACHAATDHAHPSAGHLVLWDHGDKPLTVAELSRNDLGRVQLAYLSACETAGVAPGLADEALHITAACQLAGFPHVIGTLWPIQDRFAAQIAAEVYEGLCRRGRITISLIPGALHQVIRRVRDEHPDRAQLLGAFRHFGP